jgi:D-3-phosphoglycerate dehydrogenase / 2-oxoglutarate reductase
MQVGRINPGEYAIKVLNVDSDVPEIVMGEIRGMPGIFTATFARISSEKI